MKRSSASSRRTLMDYRVVGGCAVPGRILGELRITADGAGSRLGLLTSASRGRGGWEAPRSSVGCLPATHRGQIAAGLARIAAELR